MKPQSRDTVSTEPSSTETENFTFKNDELPPGMETLDKSRFAVAGGCSREDQEEGGYSPQDVEQDFLRQQNMCGAILGPMPILVEKESSEHIGKEKSNNGDDTRQICGFSSRTSAVMTAGICLLLAAGIAVGIVMALKTDSQKKDSPSPSPSFTPSPTLAPSLSASSRRVYIEIWLDNNPEEIGFTVEEDTGNFDVIIGVPTGSLVDKGPFVDWSVDLPHPGDYRFQIFDLGSDGLCCAHGQGNYTIKRYDGSVIATGGDDIKLSEVVRFTVL